MNRRDALKAIIAAPAALAVPGAMEVEAEVIEPPSVRTATVALFDHEKFNELLGSESARGALVAQIESNLGYVIYPRTRPGTLDTIGVGDPIK